MGILVAKQSKIPRLGVLADGPSTRYSEPGFFRADGVVTARVVSRTPVNLSCFIKMRTVITWAARYLGGNTAACRRNKLYVYTARACSQQDNTITSKHMPPGPQKIRISANDDVIMHGALVGLFFDHRPRHKAQVSGGPRLYHDVCLLSRQFNVQIVTVSLRRKGEYIPHETGSVDEVFTCRWNRWQIFSPLAKSRVK